MAKKTQKSWVTDKNGAGMSSYDTILDWVLTDDNYDRYTGRKTTFGRAESRSVILKEVQGLLVSTGHDERDPNGIDQQIRKVKKKFLEAKKELGGTGSSGIDPYNKNAPPDVKGNKVNGFIYNLSTD